MKPQEMQKNEQQPLSIICPLCGKATSIRIRHLDGILRYSLRCRNCKQESEVEIKDIRQSPQRPA